VRIMYEVLDPCRLHSAVVRAAHDDEVKRHSSNWSADGFPGFSGNLFFL
jgi:hypothetical protein